MIDFDDVRADDWLAVNQFTVIEGASSSPDGRGKGEGACLHNRRPDIVVFVNGLPLGLVELKNAADEDATISLYSTAEEFMKRLVPEAGRGAAIFRDSKPTTHIP